MWKARGFRGLARGNLPVGAAAFVAIRPDDLMVGESGGNALKATVETIEYRGREFVGTARSSQAGSISCFARIMPSSRVAAFT